MSATGSDDQVEDLDNDQICHGYRDCLDLINQGRFDEAAQVIADIWPIDPRYAKALGDKLEIVRRWESAKKDDAERRRFWEWMDSRR